VVHGSSFRIEGCSLVQFLVDNFRANPAPIARVRTGSLDAESPERTEPMDVEPPSLLERDSSSSSRAALDTAEVGRGYFEEMSEALKQEDVGSRASMGAASTIAPHPHRVRNDPKPRSMNDLRQFIEESARIAD